MAYPTIDAPYGLVPVGLIGGRSYSGATRQMRIASNYGTAIGKGDLVKRVSDGTIDRDAGTSTLPDTGTLGIFMGCQYTDPNTSQLTFNNQYPGSIVASDIDAFVVDDPDVVMKVAVCSSGTTMATVARTVIGNNVAIISNTLNTTNGRGKLAVSSSPAATLTLPLKIIDVVEDTKTGSDAFQEVLVVFNAPYEDSNIQKGGHAYRVATGL
jgi:hypothetical protein|tara:strand:+ start:612 stop:1244 length:633 start_codon:yes stop_codon:yes gene_type:complete